MTEKVIVVGNLAKDIIDGEEKFGGSAANIAIGLCRLGISTGIVSVLGTDSFSSSYKIFLEDEGVDTTLIERSLDVLPVCEVFSKNNTNMDRRWFDNGCRAAMENLETRIKQTDNTLLHIVSCPPDLPRKFLHQGIKISYEPGPMLVYSHEYFDRQVANASMFIFLNKEEFTIVSGMDSGIQSSSYDFKYLKALVITLGELGSRLVIRESDQYITHNIQAVKVLTEEIVDFTGAGDNYKAGFLAGYVNDKNIPECARIGSVMGAASIKYSGGLIPKTEANRIKSAHL